MDALRSIARRVQGCVLPWIGASMLGGLLCSDRTVTLTRAPLLDAPFALPEPSAIVVPTEVASAVGRASADALLGFIVVFVVLIAAYSVRHYAFSIARLFMPQRAPYRAIVDAPWPMLTVFVAAHNEEAVVADCLRALLRTTYPHDRLTIVPVNDRSTDRTREIVDAITATAPALIYPFHRSSGKPGKAAALKDALLDIRTDIMIVFDADYLPRPSLLKELVAPFFDPQVGAVMGRVVPQNAGRNLLTRLLDLERAGGYQVNQQARMAMGLVPQYGGTVGGLRMSALDEAGGWRDDTLAEDTDMTYRLLLKGWRTAYLNYAECYEEVPERWPTRKRQLTRWAKGHNQTMLRCTVPLLRDRSLHAGCRLDGLLLLGVYLMPALLALAWVVAALLYFANVTAPLVLDLVLTLIALFALSAFGNFGVFFEIVVAARLDGHARRLRMMPLNAIGFCVTIASVTHALSGLALDALFKRELKWDKTERFRQATATTPDTVRK
ncbi:MAG TPA: glycosyltransferase family 2 protein [Pararobbsia sp.]|nr:glycosyltransferase family 2 protein [Pararobbsia sp.]